MTVHQHQGLTSENSLVRIPRVKATSRGLRHVTRGLRQILKSIARFLAQEWVSFASLTGSFIFRIIETSILTENMAAFRDNKSYRDFLETRKWTLETKFSDFIEFARLGTSQWHWAELAFSEDVCMADVCWEQGKNGQYTTSTFPIMHLICPPKFFIGLFFISPGY